MKIDVAGIERTVVITLDEKIAPKTSANFEKLCRDGFYDGISVHRVIPNYIVQTGDPLTKDASAKDKWGTGGPGYTVPAELGGKHVRGAIATARLGDAENPERASSGSQFYVALREIAPLDGQYTVFANVTSGLEFFDEIAGAPSDDKKVPTMPIKILSTRILEPEPAGVPVTDLTATEMKPAAPAESPAPSPVPADEPPAPAPTPSLAASDMKPTTPAPAPVATPEPAPAPAPVTTSSLGLTTADLAGQGGMRRQEPDPLAAASRFTPESEESMPVNVDRGMPAMPRLRANADKLSEAANQMTGRDDGFVPLTSVGASEAAPTASTSSAPVIQSDLPPMPSFTSAPEPEPEPIPLSQSEPDPLANEFPPPAQQPSSGPGAPVPPMSETMASPAATKPAKPEKPAGPLGRFIRRIW
ncbi:MAG: peptidylprolyl isomerase [Verrucomicrobiae bacterium]|nr:peptidylprolyl isomerase [Verrucomicrobiae bacterium]